MGFLLRFLPIKAPRTDAGTTSSVKITEFATVMPESGKGRTDKEKSNTADIAPEMRPDIIPSSDSLTAENPPTTAPMYREQRDNGFVTESGSSIDSAAAQNNSSRIKDDAAQKP